MRRYGNTVFDEHRYKVDFSIELLKWAKDALSGKRGNTAFVKANFDEDFSAITDAHMIVFAPKAHLSCLSDDLYTDVQANDGGISGCVKSFWCSANDINCVGLAESPAGLQREVKSQRKYVLVQIGDLWVDKTYYTRLTTFGAVSWAVVKSSDNHNRDFAAAYDDNGRLIGIVLPVIGK